MTDGNTHAINQYLDEREDWDALQEVTAELEQAEAKVEELEAKLARAVCALEHEVARSRRHLSKRTLDTLAELGGKTDE